MKKLISMIVALLVFSNMSLSFAEIGGNITKSLPTPKYSSLEDLIEAEWDKCEVATDGINSIMIKDWEAFASTLAYAWENPEYSCLEYKTQQKVCTMEYAPVCWIDGVTYGNSCMAWKTPVLYEGKCESMIDSKLHSQLKTNLRINLSVEKTFSKVSTSKLEKVVDRADKMIMNTKLLRIAEKMQIERITMLTFLKNKAMEELASR